MGLSHFDFASTRNCSAYFVRNRIVPLTPSPDVMKLFSIFWFILPLAAQSRRLSPYPATIDRRSISKSRNLVAAFWLVMLCFGAAAPETLRAEPDNSEEAALLIPVETDMRVIRVEALDSASNTWSTVAIAHLDGQSGTVKVRIPAGFDREHLRIFASTEPMFPDAYLKNRETVHTRAEVDDSMSRNGTWAGVAYAEVDTVDTESTDASVQESDIWRLRGSTLYFYNHARGLQVYDLSNPDTPVRIGSLDFAGRGQQMYVLNDDYVLLLANAPEPAVVVVRLNDGDPRIVAQEAVADSYFLESRLVGDRLYFATQHYALNEDQSEYRYTVRVNGIDFSDPENPDVLDALDLAVGDGWGNVLTATPRYMLISVGHTRYEDSDGDWWRRGWRQYSEIFVVDLQTTDGSPQLVDTVEFDGYLNDKHKFTLEDGVLTVIGQAFGRSSDNRWIRNTILETFTLNENTLGHAGSIELAPNETLYATLIDGDRAYVVTFLQKDPLFAIDLSDPANPTILGQLDVPGYSSLLQLLDDQHLFSVGIEGNRVAASLFAVDDPQNLRLLSRAYIGQEGEYSWTEANYDDRAATVLPEQNLALLPYSSHSGTGSTGIQIFSLEGDTITARGRIEHDQWARRAGALDANTLVSISESELYTIDISDLDAPSILAEETLSWYANRLFRFGEYLVQVDTNSSWSQTDAALVVTADDAPGLALAKLDLDGIRPVGFAQRGDWLYAASIDQTYDQSVSAYTAPLLRVTAIDCTDPLNPTRGTTISTELEGISDWFSTELKPLWIDDSTLLWMPADGNSIGSYYPFIDAWGLGREIGIMADIAFWPSYAPRAALFATVSVASPSAPAFLDWAIPEDTGNPWEYEISDVFASGSTAFFTRSHYWYELVPVTGENGEKYNEYKGYQENKLLSLDFSDPAILSFGAGHEINGSLEGVAATGTGGYLMMTSERVSTYDSETQTSRSFDRIGAYAFDGAQVLLLDEIEWEPASNTFPWWGNPLAYFAQTLFRPVQPKDSNGQAAIERLRLNASAELVAESALPLEGGSLYSFGANGGRLFAFTNAATTVWEVMGAPSSERFAAVYPAPSNLSADRVSYRDGEDLLVANDYYGVLAIPLEPLAPDFNAGIGGEAMADNRSGDESVISVASIEFSAPSTADQVGRLGEQRWRFRPSVQSSPDSAATDHGEGWHASAWYGWFYLSESASWVYHLEHGWNYNRAVEGGSWSYDRQLGWTWITSGAYPYVYSSGRGSWLYYLRGSGEGGKRWFYDYSANVQDWVTIERS